MTRPTPKYVRIMGRHIGLIPGSGQVGEDLRPGGLPNPHHAQAGVVLAQGGREGEAHRGLAVGAEFADMAGVQGSGWEVAGGADIADCEADDARN